MPNEYGWVVVDGIFTFNQTVTFTNNILLSASDYVNFGTLVGTSGYGIRDNAGVIEAKNSGGAWSPLVEASTDVWTRTGTVLSPTTAGDTLNLSSGISSVTGINFNTPTIGLYNFGSGVWGLVRPALATIPAAILVLQNPTAATGGATVQVSPDLQFRGTAWDTAASETIDWFQNILPVSAATPTSTFKWQHSLNGAARTTPMSLTSAGALTLLTALTVPNGGTGLATLTTAYGLVAAGATATGNLQNVGTGTSGYTLTSGGSGALPTYVATGAPIVVALADGATPALDASTGTVFTLAAAGDRTIAVPSNATNGQKIIIRHLASGGARTLALNTGAGGFRFGSDITALTQTASGKTDYIGAIYSSIDSKWDVCGYAKGF